MTESKSALEGPKPLNGDVWARDACWNLRRVRIAIDDVANFTMVGACTPATEESRVILYSEVLLLLDSLERLDRQGEVQDLRTPPPFSEETAWQPHDGNGPLV